MSRPQLGRLADGDRFGLTVGPVRKELGGDLRTLAYDGSIPGPTLVARQGSRITVDVRNDGDVEPPSAATRIALRWDSIHPGTHD